MKCICCNQVVSDWPGNFMSVTECGLCYIDLLKANTDLEKDYLDIFIQNINFVSVDKQNRVNTSEDCVTK